MNPEDYKQLSDWQNREVDIAQGSKRYGIAWDMGLGKTGGVSVIGTRTSARIWYILCPRNAFRTWKVEANKWILSYNPSAKIKTYVIDKASAEEREFLWNLRYPTDPNEVIKIICTADTFMRDWGESKAVPGKKKKVVDLKVRPKYQRPDILIIDEFKRFRNPDSIGFRLLSKFARSTGVPYVYPMTGTPGHQPKHFWTMLNLVAPTVFSSWWRFLQTFHIIDEGPWGKEIAEPKNLPAFWDILKRYVSVMKEDSPEVIANRPPIQRELLTIDLSKDQQRMYNKLAKDMYAFAKEETSEGLVIAQNELTLFTRLRQLLICPKILDESLDYGNAIADFVETWEAGEGHIVIFTPFTKALPYFEAYLRSKGYANVFRLCGGISVDEHDRAIDNFKRLGGVMLCSIMYATSFDLQPATKCFFIGYDYDPDNNKQAEKRLQRGLTASAVTAYYYTYDSTFDRRLAEIVNIKQQHMSLTIPSNLRGLFDQKIIKSDQDLTD